MSRNNYNGQTDETPANHELRQQHQEIVRERRDELVGHWDDHVDEMENRRVQQTVERQHRAHSPEHDPDSSLGL